jgi:4,5-DOPA dioxygenase extradiol
MTSTTMPAVFFGHGSPMIALETNDTTKAWKTLADGWPKPKAILCISAHWVTRGTAVTAMARPKTIHDFGAFPKALFDVEYPAPGDVTLAERVTALLAPLPVALDQQWGLDHGAWSVLCKAYPDADVPVVQLSIDATLNEQGKFDIGRKLAVLRDEGVLIMGTGNIVHNLGRMDWNARYGAPFDWAKRFNDAMRAAIVEDRPEQVVGYAAMGADASLSVPSADHFWPLLYVLGARRPDEQARIITDHIEHGSLSMTGVVLGDDATAAQRAA